MYFGEPFGGLITGARGAVLAALLRTNTPLTGRQVHGLLADQYSLWTVQQVLKSLAQLGVTTTATVGRAGVHTINDDHYAIEPLRALVDPFDALTATIRATAGDDVRAVLVFGSIARGTPGPASDVDLCVIADPLWDGRTELEDAIRARLGNDCDIIHLTPDDFSATERASVVDEIHRDGVLLLGSLPSGRDDAA